jgi:hypothetical protein
MIKMQIHINRSNFIFTKINELSLMVKKNPGHFSLLPTVLKSTGIILTSLSQLNK